MFYEITTSYVTAKICAHQVKSNHVFLPLLCSSTSAEMLRHSVLQLLVTKLSLHLFNGSDLWKTFRLHDSQVPVCGTSLFSISLHYTMQACIFNALSFYWLWMCTFIILPGTHETNCAVDHQVLQEENEIKRERKKTKSTVKEKKKNTMRYLLTQWCCWRYKHILHYDRWTRHFCQSSMWSSWNWKKVTGRTKHWFVATAETTLISWQLCATTGC